MAWSAIKGKKKGKLRGAERSGIRGIKLTKIVCFDICMIRMSEEKQKVEEIGVPELVDDEMSSNGSEGSDVKEWDDWQADEADEGETRTKCVACGEVFESAEAALAHMREKHGFDLVAFVKASTSDLSERMYHWIKMVNYLRAKGDQEVIKVDGEEWKDEKYLKPVQVEEEDPLLFYDIDNADADHAPFHIPVGSANISSATSATSQSSDFSSLSREALEKLLSSTLQQQSATSERLSLLEQQLSSLQRINKTLLDGMSYLEIIFAYAFVLLFLI